MDFFFNSFMVVLGIGAALVTLRILPIIIVSLVRVLTTKKWQAAKYKRLMARGQVEAAQWGARHGMATEE